MTDIVERLRMDPYKEQFQFEREARITLSKILAEAADEIERLREENKKLIESFRTFVGRFFGKEFLDDLDDELVNVDKEK